VSAGFAETVKSAEPISTILIGLFFFRETSSLRTYLTLVPICLGVGISCYHNEEFSMAGFLLAAGSNVCFSSRAVLAKKMSVTHTEAMDEINLFAKISIYGVMFLLPITAFMEGRGLMDLFRDLRTNMTSTEDSASHILALLALNGSMFACYNLMSYVVLRHLDLVTHSVLNVFRRVVIIVFTSVYFALYLSPFNMIGILIAVAGVLLFGYFRTTDKPKSLL
jgi:solute carrier family 35 protein E1